MKIDHAGRLVHFNAEFKIGSDGVLRYSDFVEADHPRSPEGEHGGEFVDKQGKLIKGATSKKEKPSSSTVENVAFFLHDKTGDVTGKWTGQLSASEQKNLFGAYKFGKATIQIDGAKEIVKTRVSRGFGQDFEILTYPWKDLDLLGTKAGQDKYGFKQFEDSSQQSHYSFVDEHGFLSKDLSNLIIQNATQDMANGAPAKKKKAEKKWADELRRRIALKHLMIDYDYEFVDERGFLYSEAVRGYKGDTGHFVTLKDDKVIFITGDGKMKDNTKRELGALHKEGKPATAATFDKPEAPAKPAPAPEHGKVEISPDGKLAPPAPKPSLMDRMRAKHGVTPAKAEPGASAEKIGELPAEAPKVPEKASESFATHILTSLVQKPTKADLHSLQENAASELAEVEKNAAARKAIGKDEGGMDERAKFGKTVGMPGFDKLKAKIKQLFPGRFIPAESVGKEGMPGSKGFQKPLITPEGKLAPTGDEHGEMQASPPAQPNPEPATPQQAETPAQPQPAAKPSTNRAKLEKAALKQGYTKENFADLSDADMEAKFGSKPRWKSKEEKQMQLGFDKSKNPIGDTLYNKVQSMGGISRSTAADYGLTELLQGRLSGLFPRQGGMDLEQVAIALHREGDILIPGFDLEEGAETGSGRKVDAGEYLLGQLQEGAVSLSKNVDKSISKSNEDYYAELANAERARIEAGEVPGGAEEAVRGGTAAGMADEAQGNPLTDSPGASGSDPEAASGQERGDADEAVREGDRPVEKADEDIPFESPELATYSGVA